MAPTVRTNHGRILPVDRVRFSKKKRMVLERDEYRCVRCGTDQDLTVDHIMPSSLGGTYAVHNLQTMCSGCNSAKAADFGIRERFNKRRANRKRWV